MRDYDGMVEIDDIKDRESLKAWLDALSKKADFQNSDSHSIAVELALRSAARVLPLYWDWVLEIDVGKISDFSALPILRPLLITSAISIFPTEMTKSAAYAAANAANTDYVPAANFYALNAAAAAANAAFADNADPYAAVDAVSDAAAAAEDGLDFWDAVRVDCRNLPLKPDLSSRPLWPFNNAVQDELWLDIKRRVDDLPGDWRFWITWYEHLRLGSPMPLSLLTKIALIDPKLWDQGASVVNPMIAQMWEGLEPLPPDVEANADDIVPLNETPFQVLSKNARLVTMQLDTLIEFLHQQINLLNGNNRIIDIETRDMRVLQLRAILDKVQEIADVFPEGEEPDNNALEVIDEKLPAIIEKAESVVAVDGQPDVETFITSFAGTMKLLTDSGTPGHVAAVIAGSKESYNAFKDVKAWVKSGARKNK